MRKFNSNLDLAFKEFKNQSCCSVCGYKQNTSVLHFHHINPKHKVDEIGKLISGKDYYSIIAEMTKCTILCANCHSVFHSSEKSAQKLLEEEFKDIDIDKFLSICIQYAAIDSLTDTIDIDMARRVIALEEEVRLLKVMIQRPTYISKTIVEEIKTETSIKSPTVYSGDMNEIIIQTYTRTKSLNKTTEAAFGRGKKGKYYADKVRPILRENNLI